MDDSQLVDKILDSLKERNGYEWAFAETKEDYVACKALDVMIGVFEQVKRDVQDERDIRNK